MLNQPRSTAFHDVSGSRESLIDPPADFRFRSLAAVFVIAAVIVLGRIAWVKAELQSRYLAALNATTVEYEVIPARDGRILTEAADVLATDVDQYSVQVHYRWLQDPVDEAWLRRQVRRRLSATERKDADTVQNASAQLLDQRRQMWKQLAHTTGMTIAEFQDAQTSIQQRVQRIADAVNRRRQDVLAEPLLTDPQKEGFLLSLASSLRAALTTTPRRNLQDRIVVREEESWHEVTGDVSLQVAARIHEQTHLLPGVRVVAGSRRIYPLSSVAAHLVGARTPIRESDSDVATQDLLPNQTLSESWIPRIGRFGVERSYDHQLHGVPGLRRIVRSPRLEVVESEIERHPVSGRDVVMTLHVPLQQHAERLLAEALLDRPAELLNAAQDQPQAGQTPQPVPTGGSIVVLDAHSGRILVAASAPAFSLQLFTSGSSSEWAAANQDPRHPFLSRITSMALPPGSVIKPLTAIAALESGHLDPDASFHCQGFLSRPDQQRCLIYRLYGRGHGDIALTQALAESCNVYFFHAAQQMQFSQLRDWCERFGLGRETGIDLPFEKAGNVPGNRVLTADAQQRFRREVLGLAIGQSSLTVTPLQMARIMAAIANDGWLVTPHVVSSDGTARTTSDIDDRPREIRRQKISGLTPETLVRIREGLQAVVQQPYGSGYQHVRLEGIAIAGKTGTAETAPGKADHAWFAGYVPAEQPRYAFAVVLEHGGSGGQTAGPIAREIVNRMMQLQLLR